MEANGAYVGDLVGDAVGDVVGDLVGESVGDAEGAGVDAIGADVEGSSHAPAGMTTRNEPDGLSHSSTQVAPPAIKIKQQPM